MPKLTTELQKDLKIYKKTGELGTLKNLLIEHCLVELECSDYARDRFSSILRLEIPKNTDDLLISNTEYQIIFIQTLLSRTKNLNSRAVISFLDLETEEAKNIKDIIDFELNVNNVVPTWQQKTLEKIPKTLDHLLHQEFTEILRTGKGKAKALETINKIYLDKLVKIFIY